MHEADVCKSIEEEAVRVLEDDVHSMGVDDGDPFDLGKPGRRAVSLGRSHEREASCLGIEGFAVVEHHASPQREAEPDVAQSLPPGGQLRLNDLGVRDGDQWLEDVVEHFDARLLRANERVEARPFFVRAGGRVERDCGG